MKQKPDESWDDFLLRINRSEQRLEAACWLIAIILFSIAVVIVGFGWFN